VPHPLRCGASECSAKGRSAIRSDSQRRCGRTRWEWPSGLGIKVGAPVALPSGRISLTAASRRRTATSVPPPTGLTSERPRQVHACAAVLLSTPWALFLPRAGSRLRTELLPLSHEGNPSEVARVILGSSSGVRVAGGPGVANDTPRSRRKPGAPYKRDGAQSSPKSWPDRAGV